jgi:hypothetical protein
MRYVNIALGLLMVAFAAVQYNDPDPEVWVPIYLISATWALAAAFLLPRIVSAPAIALLGLCVLAYAVLVVYYWPQTPGFWRQEVWWNDEEAREGMGMMIALAVLLSASYAVFRARSRRS